MTVSLVDNCSALRILEDLGCFDVVDHPARSDKVFWSPGNSCQRYGSDPLGYRGTSQRSEPDVQPSVAYGRCVAGNGGVLSVLTMNSGHLPAGSCREVGSWTARAARAEEARLRGHWIRNKYFNIRGRNRWLFTGHGLDDRGVWRGAALYACDEVKIRRHKKVKMDANPFDPAWDAYFENRHRERLLAKHRERSQGARLLKRQEGRCTHCGQLLTVETGHHEHHVIPRSADGTDEDSNLELIHLVCHQAHHVHHPAPRSVAGRTEASSAT